MKFTRCICFYFAEPNFVSTYEIGDFIYFFFRETAVEYINCGKVNDLVKYDIQ